MFYKTFEPTKYEISDYHSKEESKKAIIAETLKGETF